MWLGLYHVFKLYIQRVPLFGPHPLSNPINQLNMKPTLGYLTVASAMSIATATSCTHEVASAWPYTEEEPCTTVACAQEQAYANCIAVSAVSPGRTCVRPSSMLKRGVDLDCTSSETCTVFTDNSLLCLEQYNGG
jgi:hypothetical protein